MADYEMLPVEQLLFDKANPRLVEFDSKGGKEKDIISLLWDSMNVKELVLSIAHSGYFINDPLVVAVENGQSIVIEGNRRLAAVKILLSPGDYPWSIPEVGQDRLDFLKKLPVVFMKREESWPFIGFKHVNGAVKWDSYARPATSPRFTTSMVYRLMKSPCGLAIRIRLFANSTAASWLLNRPKRIPNSRETISIGQSFLFRIFIPVWGIGDFRNFLILNPKIAIPMNLFPRIKRRSWKSCASGFMAAKKWRALLFCVTKTPI